MAGIAVLICLLLVASPGRGEPTDQADCAIQYLISVVASSELTFIRNGSEYTPDQAAAHMDRKYQYFKQDIETHEEFIELCATKSMLTGKAYLVIDREGKEFRTSDWLRVQLAAYHARSQ